MPEETFYVEGIQIAKRGIAMDIQKFVTALSETKFVETFKAEPKPDPPASAPTRHCKKLKRTGESQIRGKAKTSEAKPAKKLKTTKPPNKPSTFPFFFLIYFIGMPIV
jgi:hypothetical protein